MPTVRPAERPDLLSVLKALADPTRLAIVDVLSRGAFNVSELSGILGAGQSAVSRHLRILTEAGVCAWRREGREVYYRLIGSGEPDLLAPVLAHLRRTRPPERDHRVVKALQARRRRSRTYFEAVAAEMDGVPPGPDVGEQCVAALGERDAVADVGTGGGRLVPLLLRQAKRVIAVDGSPAMLARAVARTAEDGRVEFRLGELERLPLDDGEVDGALAHMVVHHAPDPAHAIAELARVVKPGGRLVIGDLLPHDQEWMRLELADQWLGLDPGDLRHWLEAAGLEDIHIETRRDPDRSLAAFVAAADKPLSDTRRSA